MKSTRMNQLDEIAQLAFDYRSDNIGRSLIVHADCFEWLGRVPENSIHAIVTDPPYGVKEYEFDQIEKGRMVMEVYGGFPHHLTGVHEHRFQDSQLLIEKNVTLCDVSLLNGPEFQCMP